MVRSLLIPVVTALLVVSAMLYQACEPSPTLAEPPPVAFAAIPGFDYEEREPSEAELTSLPPDTRFVKGRYVARDGSWYSVSAVIGGKMKSSIHRPELCLPSQGFQMTQPRDLVADGKTWHALTLLRGEAPPVGFAYMFFNQTGFRTSSHLARIFRDVWDRSVLNRIDRWVMVTVYASKVDDLRFARFLEQFQGVLP